MRDKVATLCDTIIYFVQGFEAVVQLGHIARASPEEITDLLACLDHLKEDVITAVEAVQDEFERST